MYGLLYELSFMLNEISNSILCFSLFCHFVTNILMSTKEVIQFSTQIVLNLWYAYVGRNSVSSIGQNQSLTSLLN